MNYIPGDKVVLRGRLFANSQTHSGMDRSGTWYIYDGKLINGRYRVTSLTSRVGQLPISINISGYVNADDIHLLED